VLTQGAQLAADPARPSDRFRAADLVEPERIIMKNALAWAIAGVALATLSGCIVAPARPYYGGSGYVAPAGVVYVAPTYASPGPGWAWEYHAQYGWGWHHPQYGWHRGWK
jgi:hypothetical protein